MILRSLNKWFTFLVPPYRPLHPPVPTHIFKTRQISLDLINGPDGMIKNAENEVSAETIKFKLKLL